MYSILHFDTIRAVSVNKIYCALINICSLINLNLLCEYNY